MSLRSILSTWLLILPAAGLFAQSPAPITRHPDNPHYLLFRGKPTVLITSGEHYGAVMNLDFDFIPYLDELQSRHLNLTRTFSGTYHEIPGSFGITDNTLSPIHYCSPWQRSDQPGATDGGNKFDLTQFNPEYFARLKRFLTEAGRRGIVVEYSLFCTFYNDALWNINPLNARNNVNGIAKGVGRRDVYTLKHADITRVQEAFVRKVASELNGFDNVYFEICNEPYFENVTDAWQAHIAQVLTDAEKALPHQHLIAQNIANGRKKVDKPDPNVSILNFHYATPPDTVAMNYASNRILADDETGFRGKADATYRTEGWEFILAGGAIYSSLDYSFTGKTPSGTLTKYASPGGGSTALRTQLGYLHQFMDSLDFVKMKPMNGILTAGQVTTPIADAQAQSARIHILGNPPRQYALYIHGGTSAELQLQIPAGHYTVQWLNPRTGQWEKTDTLDHPGGAARLISPPYTEDIAARIVTRP